MKKTIDEDMHFRLLRLLEAPSQKTQRDISTELGISLGAINYCLKALIQKGEVKINNFRTSDNKLRYAYILTPRGIEAKARLTAGFLQRKMAEYEALQVEIERLKVELADKPE